MSAAWPTARLGDVLSPVVREQIVDPSREYPLLGVRLDGQGPFHRETVLGTQTSASRLYEVRSGDFIYSRLFAWRGAFGLIEPELNAHFVSNEFPTFTPINGRIDPKFLLYWFRLPHVLRRVEAVCSGSTPLTRNRFKEQYFFALEIPLPPLAEQRRIVARIEELAAKVEEANKLRTLASNELTQIGSKFLVEKFDCIDAPVRPLSEVAIKRTGVAYRADDFSTEKGVPVVRLKEIGTKAPQVFLTNPDAYANVWLKPGDIILAKTSFSTGAMCIWEAEGAVLNQNAVMLRAREGIEQRYLYAWLGQQIHRYLNDHLADPKFYPYIREADLVRWPVPVPSRDEQRRIVAELDALQAKVDAVKALQTETAIELDAMLPAILDKAFKGEL